MSLRERESRFDRFCSKFPCERIHPLLAMHRIRADRLEWLRFAAAAYLVRCLPDRSELSLPRLLSEGSLALEIERQLPRIPNITPNGAVVPKTELNLQYNLFVQALAEVIEDLGVGDFISSFFGTPLLRFKGSRVTEGNLGRSYPTERMHTEAWIPSVEPHSCTVYIPLFGDVRRNGVRFFGPPSDFDENWLKPIDSFSRGEEIAKRYVPIDLPYEPGWVYFADIATMHQTARQDAAGPRISIDNTFTWRREDGPSPDPQLTQGAFLGLGTREFIVFSQRMGEYSQSLGSKQHQTSQRRIVGLGL